MQFRGTTIFYGSYVKGLLFLSIMVYKMKGFLEPPRVFSFTLHLMLYNGVTFSITKGAFLWDIRCVPTPFVISDAVGAFIGTLVYCNLFG